MVERDLYADEWDEDLGGSMSLCAYLVMTHEGLMWTSDPQVRKGTAFTTPSPDLIRVTADTSRHRRDGTRLSYY